MKYLLDTGKHAPNDEDKLKKLEAIRKNLERYGGTTTLNFFIFIILLI